MYFQADFLDWERGERKRRTMRLLPGMYENIKYLIATILVELRVTSLPLLQWWLHVLRVNLSRVAIYALWLAKLYFMSGSTNPESFQATASLRRSNKPSVLSSTASESAESTCCTSLHKPQHPSTDHSIPFGLGLGLGLDSGGEPEARTVIPRVGVGTWCGTSTQQYR